MSESVTQAPLGSKLRITERMMPTNQMVKTRLAAHTEKVVDEAGATEGGVRDVRRSPVGRARRARAKTMAKDPAAGPWNLQLCRHDAGEVECQGGETYGAEDGRQRNLRAIRADEE